MAPDIFVVFDSNGNMDTLEPLGGRIVSHVENY